MLNTRFNNRSRPMAVILAALLCLLWRCAPPTDPNAFFSSDAGGSGFGGFGPRPLGIKVALVSKSSLGSRIKLNDLELADTLAADVSIGVSGCSSGYVVEQLMVNLGVVNLYKGDVGCVVKLVSFTLNSTAYKLENPKLALSNWLAGNAAVFQSTSDTEDLINVYVVQQVTNTGVQPTDQVLFSFQEIAQGSGPASPEVAPIPITVAGADPPNFKLVQTRFLSSNTDGSSNYAFTLECNEMMTSTTQGYTCGATLLNTQVDYILINDTFSGRALTVAQANAAFAVNTPTHTLTVVPPGNSDQALNSLNNGGFYTSNSSPMIGTPIPGNNYSQVFLLRRLDKNGNALSYLYFYVLFPPLVQQ